MIDRDTDADDKVNGLSMNEHEKISMNEHEKISMNEHEKISMNEHNTHTPSDGGGTNAESIFTLHQMEGVLMLSLYSSEFQAQCPCSPTAWATTTVGSDLHK